MKMTDNLAGLAAAITKHLLEQQEEFMRTMPGFIEHDFNAFQRGDYASQVTGMMQLRLGGVYSVNSYVVLDRQDLMRVVTEALENF